MFSWGWDSVFAKGTQWDTTVSTKVVPQKRYSVRDNAEWSYGYKEFGVD